jgi:hypothetical protein
MTTVANGAGSTAVWAQSIKGDVDVSADNMDRCAARERPIDVARRAEG